jgi:hypothetical protein
MNKKLLTLLLACTAATTLCAAQDKPESEKFYRLDFVMKDVEAGKTLSSHIYSVIAASHRKNQIRTNTKVPFLTRPNEWQWNEIGTSIDCDSVNEVPDGLSLFVSASVESVLDEASVAARPASIRHNAWSSFVVIPIKKPTVIFSSDDPASKRQMQVELTATPIR